MNKRRRWKAKAKRRAAMLAIRDASVANELERRDAATVAAQWGQQFEALARFGGGV